MPLGPMKTKAQKKEGMHQVMHEFKHGELHSGSKTGPTVTNRKQAIAIALKQTGQSKYARGGQGESRDAAEENDRTYYPELDNRNRVLPNDLLIGGKDYRLGRYAPGGIVMPIIPSVNRGPFIGVPKLATGGRPLNMRPPHMRMPFAPMAPFHLPMRTPFVNRPGFVHMEKGGFIDSKVPGRTDKHYVKVHEGSYVLPADHVSALGQNNSNAGAEVIRKMFAPGAQFGPRLSIPRFAGGGAVEPVPIVVAGGEVIIPPSVVKRIGKGDLERGHQILDKWVLATRDKHIKKLESLKPPKGAKNDRS